ncbi:hypothetical protein D3C71_1751660 [compost metagenome]
MTEQISSVLLRNRPRYLVPTLSIRCTVLNWVEVFPVTAIALIASAIIMKILVEALSADIWVLIKEKFLLHKLPEN